MDPFRTLVDFPFADRIVEADGLGLVLDVETMMRSADVFTKAVDSPSR
jgi:hypothetical protein